MPSSGILCHVALVGTDVRRLLVTANVPSSPILVTLMEVLRSSKMSILKRATWHNIPEDGILLYNHCDSSFQLVEYSSHCYEEHLRVPSNLVHLSDPCPSSAYFLNWIRLCGLQWIYTLADIKIQATVTNIPYYLL
jgi:hypothetical protein